MPFPRVAALAEGKLGVERRAWTRCYVARRRAYNSRGWMGVSGSVTTIDILHQIIIVVTQSIEHVRGELLWTKSFANGGKCVRHTRHLVEVVGDGEIMKLHLPKRSADGVRPPLRLRSKNGMKSHLRVPRRSGEDDQ